jgi:hypothetical protein
MPLHGPAAVIVPSAVRGVEESVATADKGLRIMTEGHPAELGHAGDGAVGFHNGVTLSSEDALAFDDFCAKLEKSSGPPRQVRREHIEFQRHGRRLSIGLRVLAAMPEAPREEQNTAISRSVLTYARDKALRLMLREPKSTYETVGERICQELAHFKLVETTHGRGN